MAPIKSKHKVVEMIRAGQVISGIHDCHVPGLTSLVFRERVNKYDGMRRVYFVQNHGQLVYWDKDGDWTVMPHNHRQDIVLFRLAGSPQNVMVSVTDESVLLPRMWEYEFGSALIGGEFELKKRRQVGYCLDAARELPGYGKYMAAESVHTILAGPGDAWLVEEGELMDGPTYSYSRLENKRLETGGLYNKIEGEALQEACRQLAGLIDA